MPSCITHCYFICDIYEKLPLDKKLLLKDQIENLKLFSISTTPLDFYFSFNFRKMKKVKKFSNYFHSHKTGEFIITLINYIKYNYYKDNPEAIAYLYSTISHYILDSKIHPYIDYNIQPFIKNNKNSDKIHRIFETLIEQYFIKTREQTIPKKYNDNTFLEHKHITKELEEIINFSYKEVFKIDNFYKEYIKSIKRMKFSYKFFLKKKHGIKNDFFYLIDKITPKKVTKLSYLSYKNIDYLNNNYNYWNYPQRKNKKYNKSFVNLYIEALSESLNIIKEVNLYLYENKKIDLYKLIKNYSYITGLNIKKNEAKNFF